MPKSDRNITIIGAGPAGLTAAYQVLEKNPNYNVTILECADKIGGISASVNCNGNMLDYGPHRYHAKKQEVFDFWKKIMPIQTEPSCDDKDLNRSIDNEKHIHEYDPEKIDDIWLIRQRITRIYFDGKFYDYPITLRAQTFLNMGFWKSIKAGFSYLASVLHKREEKSLEDFFINRFGKVLYQQFFEYYTENLWGRHPREINPSWGAQRVKGVSVSAVLKNAFMKLFKIKQKKVETSLISSFIYPKNGSGHAWDVLMKKISDMGGNLILNANVDKVNVENNKIVSVEYTKDNTKHVLDADYVVSSMPLAQLVDAIESTPQNIRDIAHDLPYRDYIVVGLLVDKLDIKNTTKVKTVNNQVPDVWIYVQDRNVKLGRFAVFNNFSPYSVADYKNSMWLGLEYFVTENDEYWNMSDKEMSEYAIKEAKKIGIISDKTNIKHVSSHKMKKAYPAYFDSYDQIDKVEKHFCDIDGLYCVGRNGRHVYNNIDDSVISGMNAAKLIDENKPQADWKL